MTTEDIRAGIIRILRENTDVENITGEDLEQTKDYSALKKDGEGKTLPVLQVLVDPVTASMAAAGCHRDKSVLVDISYMEERYTSRKNIQRKLAELERILLPYFRIGDRAFTPVLSFGITDGIGHCTFPLNYTDAIPVEVKEPPAGAIDLNL
mgnify:CR=1 FL=1